MAPTEMNHPANDTNPKNASVFERSDRISIWKENQSCTLAK